MNEYEKTMDIIRKEYDFDEEQKKMPIHLPISRFRGLCGLFKKCGFKVGAEIGVSTGRYSKWICQKNPGVKLFCIDPWEAYDEYVEQHTEEGQKNLNKYFEEAKTRLKEFNCEFVRKYSMEAIEDFQDNSLDFVFIDGNHSFEYVVEDIAQWSKKVRPGGIISGHDFWRSYHANIPFKVTEKERIRLCQVKDVVESWTYAHKLRPYFITRADKCASWFWVKKDE